MKTIKLEFTNQYGMTCHTTNVLDTYAEEYFKVMKANAEKLKKSGDILSYNLSMEEGR